MFRRTIVIALVLALLVPAAAVAQTGGGGGGAFGPLPQAPPAETPTPEASDNSNSLTSDLGGRETLLIIAGVLLVAFVGIGVYISRDARRALPEGRRPDSHRLREQGPHKHKRQAKARARARTKAQRDARKRNR
jgi:hypothetical protein